MSVLIAILEGGKRYRSLYWSSLVVFPVLWFVVFVSLFKPEPIFTRLMPSDLYQRKLGAITKYQDYQSVYGDRAASAADYIVVTDAILAPWRRADHPGHSRMIACERSLSDLPTATEQAVIFKRDQLFACLFPPKSVLGR